MKLHLNKLITVDSRTFHPGDAFVGDVKLAEKLIVAGAEAGDEESTALIKARKAEITRQRRTAALAKANAARKTKKRIAATGDDEEDENDQADDTASADGEE